MFRFLVISNHCLLFSEEFLRKGKVGDWENHLTSEEDNSIDAMTESYFGKTTKKFIYNLD